MGLNTKDLGLEKASTNEGKVRAPSILALSFLSIFELNILSPGRGKEGTVICRLCTSRSGVPDRLGGGWTSEAVAWQRSVQFQQNGLHKFQVTNKCYKNCLLSCDYNFLEVVIPGEENGLLEGFLLSFNITKALMGHRV